MEEEQEEEEESLRVPDPTLDPNTKEGEEESRRKGKKIRPPQRVLLLADEWIPLLFLLLFLLTGPRIRRIKLNTEFRISRPREPCVTDVLHDNNNNNNTELICRTNNSIG